MTTDQHKTVADAWNDLSISDQHYFLEEIDIAERAKFENRQTLPNSISSPSFATSNSSSKSSTPVQPSLQSSMQVSSLSHVPSQQNSSEDEDDDNNNDTGGRNVCRCGRFR